MRELLCMRPQLAGFLADFVSRLLLPIALPDALRRKLIPCEVMAWLHRVGEGNRCA